MSIANPQTFNRYAYCGNDPINQTDLLGLMSSDATHGSNGNWGGELGLNDPHYGGPEVIEERLQGMAAIPFLLGMFHVFSGHGDGEVAYNHSPQDPPGSSGGDKPPTTVGIAFTVQKGDVQTEKEQNEENTFLAAAERSKKAFQIDNGASAINRLETVSATNSITKVSIFGHATQSGMRGRANDWSGIYLTGEMVSNPASANISELTTKILNKQINIAKNGTIEFMGCNTSAIASELASRLGKYGRGDITVVGANNNIALGKDRPNVASSYTSRDTSTVNRGNRDGRYPSGFDSYRWGRFIGRTRTRSF